MSYTVTDPPPQKRRRGRPPIPRDVQRERLLVAAQRVFEKLDFEKARVADILAEAGMSSRSFYEFFDSKEDIAAECVDAIARGLVARFQTVLADTEEPIERISRMLETYLSLFPSIRFDLDRIGGAAGQRMREVRRTYVTQIAQTATRELQLAHERGQIPRRPDPIAVDLIVHGIEGLSFRYFAEGRTDELAALHPRFVDLLVRALL